MAIYSGFSHQTWWFSIATLNYQRVSWMYISDMWKDLLRNMRVSWNIRKMDVSSGNLGIKHHKMIGGLEPWNFMFPSYWEFHHPNCYSLHHFRRVGKPPSRMNIEGTHGDSKNIIGDQSCNESFWVRLLECSAVSPLSNQTWQLKILVSFFLMGKSSITPLKKMDDIIWYIYIHI